MSERATAYNVGYITLQTAMGAERGDPCWISASRAIHGEPVKTQAIGYASSA